MNFLTAYTKWVAAGKPLRDQAHIEELFKICQDCPRFFRVGPEVGRCLECGCWLKKQGDPNKLAWPTEGCPLKKWSANVDDSNERAVQEKSLERPGS